MVQRNGCYKRFNHLFLVSNKGLTGLTDKELLNQFKAIEKMPERDKDVVKTLIDAFITKGKLKQLVL
jgi:hypothetical protein